MTVARVGEASGDGTHVEEEGPGEERREGGRRNGQDEKGEEKGNKKGKRSL